jgi:KUP system potassium uptake protein
VSSEIKAIPSIRVSKLIEQKKTDTNILPKTVFFMSRETVKSVRDRIPTLGNMFVTRYGILPRDIIFLSVLVTKHAYVRGPRYHIIPLYKGENGTIRAIQIHYGFMEKLDVENDIRKIVHEENLGISPDPHNWTIEMLQEKVWIGPSFKGWRKLRYLLFKMLLKNADNADHYFHVGRKINLSYEVLPVHVH